MVEMREVVLAAPHLLRVRAAVEELLRVVAAAVLRALRLK
jgi:hypothetical protein